MEVDILRKTRRGLCALETRLCLSLMQTLSELDIPIDDAWEMLDAAQTTCSKVRDELPEILGPDVLSHTAPSVRKKRSPSEAELMPSAGMSPNVTRSSKRSRVSTSEFSACDTSTFEVDHACSNGDNGMALHPDSGNEDHAPDVSDGDIMELWADLVHTAYYDISKEVESFRRLGLAAAIRVLLSMWDVQHKRNQRVTASWKHVLHICRQSEIGKLWMERYQEEYNMPVLNFRSKRAFERLRLRVMYRLQHHCDSARSVVELNSGGKDAHACSIPTGGALHESVSASSSSNSVSRHPVAGHKDDNIDVEVAEQITHAPIIHRVITSPSSEHMSMWKSLCHEAYADLARDVPGLENLCAQPALRILLDVWGIDVPCAEKVAQSWRALVNPCLQSRSGRVWAQCFSLVPDLPVLDFNDKKLFNKFVGQIAYRWKSSVMNNLHTRCEDDSAMEISGSERAASGEAVMSISTDGGPRTHMSLPPESVHGWIDLITDAYEEMSKEVHDLFEMGPRRSVRVILTMWNVLSLMESCTRGPLRGALIACLKSSNGKKWLKIYKEKPNLPALNFSDPTVLDIVSIRVTFQWWMKRSCDILGLNPGSESETDSTDNENNCMEANVFDEGSVLGSVESCSVEALQSWIEQCVHVVNDIAEEVPGLKNLGSMSLLRILLPLWGVELPCRESGIQPWREFLGPCLESTRGKTWAERIRSDDEFQMPTIDFGDQRIFRRVVSQMTIMRKKFSVSSGNLRVRNDRAAMDDDSLSVPIQMNPTTDHFKQWFKLCCEAFDDMSQEIAELTELSPSGAVNFLLGMWDLIPWRTMKGFGRWKGLLLAYMGSPSCIKWQKYYEEECTLPVLNFKDDAVRDRIRVRMDRRSSKKPANITTTKSSTESSESVDDDETAHISGSGESEEQQGNATSVRDFSRRRSSMWKMANRIPDLSGRTIAEATPESLNTWTDLLSEAYESFVAEVDGFSELGSTSVLRILLISCGAMPRSLPYNGNQPWREILDECISSSSGCRWKARIEGDTDIPLLDFSSTSIRESLRLRLRNRIIKSGKEKYPESFRDTEIENSAIPRNASSEQSRKQVGHVSHTAGVSNQARNQGKCDDFHLWAEFCISVWEQLSTEVHGLSDLGGRSIASLALTVLGVLEPCIDHRRSRWAKYVAQCSASPISREVSERFRTSDLPALDFTDTEVVTALQVRTQSRLVSWKSRLSTSTSQFEEGTGEESKTARGSKGTGIISSHGSLATKKGNRSRGSCVDTDIDDAAPRYYDPINAWADLCFTVYVDMAGDLKGLNEFSWRLVVRLLLTMAGQLPLKKRNAGNQTWMEYYDACLNSPRGKVWIARLKRKRSMGIDFGEADNIRRLESCLNTIFSAWDKPLPTLSAEYHAALPPLNEYGRDVQSDEPNGSGVTTQQTRSGKSVSLKNPTIEQLELWTDWCCNAYTDIAAEVQSASVLGPTNTTRMVLAVFGVLPEMNVGTFQEYQDIVEECIQSRSGKDWARKYAENEGLTLLNFGSNALIRLLCGRIGRKLSNEKKAQKAALRGRNKVSVKKNDDADNTHGEIPSQSMRKDFRASPNPTTTKDLSTDTSKSRTDFIPIRECFDIWTDFCDKAYNDIASEVVELEKLGVQQTVRVLLHLWGVRTSHSTPVDSIPWMAVVNSCRKSQSGKLWIERFERQKILPNLNFAVVRTFNRLVSCMRRRWVNTDTSVSVPQTEQEQCEQNHASGNHHPAVNPMLHVDPKDIVPSIVSNNAEEKVNDTAPINVNVDRGVRPPSAGGKLGGSTSPTSHNTESMSNNSRRQYSEELHVWANVCCAAYDDISNDVDDMASLGPSSAVRLLLTLWNVIPPSKTKSFRPWKFVLNVCRHSKVAGQWTRRVQEELDLPQLDFTDRCVRTRLGAIVRQRWIRRGLYVSVGGGDISSDESEEDENNIGPIYSLGDVSPVSGSNECMNQSETNMKDGDRITEINNVTEQNRGEVLQRDLWSDSPSL